MTQEILDPLLDAIDNAGEGTDPGLLFASSAAKERYETLWMYAFRKGAAGRYHRERVAALETTYAEEVPSPIATDSGPMPLDYKGGSIEFEARITIQQSPSDLTFELSAFLAALRSGIDFVAKAAAWHVRGLSCASVGDILRHLDQGKSSPVHERFASWTDWLNALRDYRDELVHRQVIALSCGWQRIRRPGHATVLRFPAVVPLAPTTAALDTRRSREAESPENFLGTDVTEIEAYVQEAGTGKLMNFSAIAKPAPGYVRITEFMDATLRALTPSCRTSAPGSRGRGFPCSRR
ncbi:MAG: hypothetical protein ACQGVC_01705 [Myxococcota bacterium]